MHAPRVLVADDDALTRRFFADALSARGVVVEAVATGTEVLTAIKRARFDLIITDLRMPGPTGTALLESIRSQSAEPIPALVAISGELPTAERLRLVGTGFLDALEKPVSQAQLSWLLECAGFTAVGATPGTGPRPDQQPDSTPVVADHAHQSDLDDAAALRALGTPATVAAMRSLLRQDLPAQCESLRCELEAGRAAAAAGLLHRLRAGFGMCGLTRLETLSLELQRSLEASSDRSEALHHQWQHAASAALAALHAAAAGD